MNTLLAITLQAALLAAIVFAITKLAARHIPPAWRAALWFLVIARLLIPIAPPSPLSLQNLFASPPAPAAQSTFGKGVPRIEISDPIPSGNELIYTANITPAAPAPTPFPWQRLLIALWAAGAILSLTLLLARALILRKRLSKSNTPPPQQTLDILQGCRDELSLRYPVKISVSSEIAAPALTGFLPARLIIPANSETLTFPELRHIFLHELAHIKLGHLAFHWLALLARCLHWFNPLVHLAAARLRHECELAADATALARIEETEHPAYGQTIVDALARATRLNSPLALAMAPNFRDLETRLRALKLRRASPRQNIAAAALLMLLTACGLTGRTTSLEASNQPQTASREKTPAPELLTRSFKVPVVAPDKDAPETSTDLAAFLKSIQAGQRLRKPYVDSDPDVARKVNKSRHNAFAALLKVLRTISSTQPRKPPGGHFQTQKSWFYYPRTGAIFVRATAEDLEKVELGLSLFYLPLEEGEKQLTRTGPVKPGPLMTRSIKLNGPFITDLSSPPDLDSLLRALDVQRRLETPYFHAEATVVQRVRERRYAAFTKMTNALATIGQNPNAPKSWTVDTRNHSLLVRATESELNAIEAGLSLLDPPGKQLQVTYTAHILDATTEAAEKLLKDLAPSRSFTSTNELILLNDTSPQKVNDLSLTGSRVLLENVKDSALSTNVVVTGREFYLSPSRVKLLLKEAMQMKGVEVLSAPILTTVVGRQARISIEESRTVMTPLTYPKGEVIPFGPVVDILAKEFDGERLEYNTTLTITEFLGYDKTTKENAPLPRFRVRQLNANTITEPGLTHLFNVPAQDLDVNWNFDVATGLPNPTKGAPTITEKAGGSKRLLFMITPTLVDGTGNIAFPEKHAK